MVVTTFTPTVVAVRNRCCARRRRPRCRLLLVTSPLRRTLVESAALQHPPATTRRPIRRRPHRHPRRAPCPLRRGPTSPRPHIAFILKVCTPRHRRRPTTRCRCRPPPRAVLLLREASNCPRSSRHLNSSCSWRSRPWAAQQRRQPRRWLTRLATPAAPPTATGRMTTMTTTPMGLPQLLSVARANGRWGSCGPEAKTAAAPGGAGLKGRGRSSSRRTRPSASSRGSTCENRKQRSSSSANRASSRPFCGAWVRGIL